MNTMMRKVGLALVVGGALAMAGCETSNENEADKLQKSVGAPGAPPATAAKGGQVPSQAHSQEEYASRRKDPVKSAMENEYAASKKTGGGKSQAR